MVRPDWEKGLRGRLYTIGRAIIPLAVRRAVRRRLAPERLLGIRKPDIDIPSIDFDPNEFPPGRPDLVILPVIAWTYRRQRPQQLAEALARRGRRVFYGAVRGPGEPRHAAGAAPAVTLLPLEGVAREDLGDLTLGGAALSSAFASLEDARRRWGIYEAAILVQSPFWEPLARRLRETFGWRIVYDCLDRHSGFATNRPGLLEQPERRLAESADLVVATSEVLRAGLSAWSPHARLLPNACDADLFDLPAPHPADIERLTVGYVGAVDEWFDTSLFEALARLRPNWSFQIVGGAEGPGAVPRHLPNVTFHGERPHGELPTLRAAFHVEIIPFRINDLTNAVDPVKLYEALAGGRGVVATPMESLAPFARRGLLRLASTPAEFVDAIEKTVLAPASEAEGRREFARENTWDDRAALLDGWIRELWPRVTLIVVHRRGPERLRRCLAALAHRTDWPRLETLLVADGPEASIPPEALEMRTLVVPEPRGLASAVNAGVRETEGELICFLDSSAVPTRGWISSLVRHLEFDPELGIVCPSRPEEAGHSGPGLRPSLSCAALRRRTYDAVGPLSEEGGEAAAAEDYARRLRASGLRLSLAADAVVRHDKDSRAETGPAHGTARRRRDSSAAAVARERTQS
jgi:glycosyltransferase involved in cell wall biosynthesis